MRSWSLVGLAWVGAIDGLPQAVPPQVVVTPAGVTDELVLRDGTRAYGRVERVEGGLVTFTTTAGATIHVQAVEIVSIRPVDGRVVAGEFRRAELLALKRSASRQGAEIAMASSDHSEACCGEVAVEREGDSNAPLSHQHEAQGVDRGEFVKVGTFEILPGVFQVP